MEVVDDGTDSFKKHEQVGASRGFSQLCSPPFAWRHLALEADFLRLVLVSSVDSQREPRTECSPIFEGARPCTRS